NLHAEPAACDSTMHPQLLHYRPGTVRRYGKANAHGTAIWRIYCGIDPDHIAMEVKSRATGIAAIDCCVNLEEVVVGARMEITSASGNNSAADRIVEAEGAADRENPVADPGRVTIAPSRISEWAPGVDLQQCKIGQGVTAYHPRGVLGGIVYHYCYCFGVFDDMIVGDDIPAWIYDKARAKGDAGYFRAWCRPPAARIQMTTKELVKHFRRQSTQRAEVFHEAGFAVL